MKIGNKQFDVQDRTYIMGILNVTPDSFSDGGKWNEVDVALARVEEMIEEGADIIDVGGESTRPGYTQISEKDELERIVPIVKAIKSRFDVPLSIDTYKWVVAKAALEEGADLVNDIWGLKWDPRMADVIADYNAACCLMHNKHEVKYENFVVDVLKEIQQCLYIARDAGIANDKIIIDPGVGFGKTYDMNLEVINRLEAFQQLGYPVLLGTSRKGFIGRTLDLPSDERVEGTLTTTVMAVMKGCAFVRVHDIKENKRAIQMAEAILGRKSQNG